METSIHTLIHFRVIGRVEPIPACRPESDQMVDLNLLAVEAILLTTMQKKPQTVQNGIIISV